MQLNPQNMTALIVDAQIKTFVALTKIKEAGRPPEDKLPQYPDAYKAYISMQASYDKIDGMGYQDMPPEAYKKWLKSIEVEKKRQENLELQEKMKREIEMLKKMKVTMTDHARG